MSYFICIRRAKEIVEGNSENVIWIIRYNGIYKFRENSTEDLEVERYSVLFMGLLVSDSKWSRSKVSRSEVVLEDLTAVQLMYFTASVQMQKQMWQ